MFALEFVNEVINQPAVKILTTQVGVTSSGLDLEDTLLDGEERDIESTTTKIKDEDVALTLGLLVETVGNSSSSRLVDDTEDVQSGNETSILGGLTLGVVEVGGNSDDSVVNGTTEVRLSRLTHLDQDHGGDFLRCELLGLTLELNLDDRLGGLVNNLEGEVLGISLDLRVGELAADQTLSVEDCVVRVHGDLVLSSIADKTLGVGEGNERGGGSVTLVVGNDFDTVITEDTYARVGGSQIDTNSGGHGECVCGSGRGVSQEKGKRREMIVYSKFTRECVCGECNLRKCVM